MADSEPSSDQNHPDSGRGEVLAERRLALEEQLRSIKDEALTAAGGIGFGKRVGEGTNIAVERLVEVAKHDRLLAELETVRRAQEKQVLDEATHCDACGATIPGERLEAIPWAIKCVDCAAR